MKISFCIDCIAVIAKDWDQKTVGQNKFKRELSLTDKSKECILATLWGPSYNEPDYTGTCVLIHNGVINQFNGLKHISCAPNTLFWHNPVTEMAVKLKSWFDEEMRKLKE